MIAGSRERDGDTADRLHGPASRRPSARRQETVNDRSLIPAAIEEALRFEAPSQVQRRCASRAVEHHSQTVPKDSIAASRTPIASIFTARAKGHMSLGYGLHFCFGAALGRLKKRVALDEMLKRWPEWDVDYERACKVHTTSVRGWGACPIRTKRT